MLSISAIISECFFWHLNFLYHGCLAELNKSYINPFWLSLVISASFYFYMNDCYIKQSTGLTGALHALLLMIGHQISKKCKNDWFQS